MTEGGFAGFIENMRGGDEDRPDPLERARLAADKPAEPYDDDERQAALLSRRYEPGRVFDLSRRLADTETELAAELELIEKGEKRAEQVRRMHEHGQIHALDIPAYLGDEGDVAKVGRLERRAEGLRRQIAEAQEMISPQQQREPDPFAAGAKRAHQAFADATRSMMAEAADPAPGAAPFRWPWRRH